MYRWGRMGLAGILEKRGEKDGEDGACGEGEGGRAGG